MQPRYGRKTDTKPFEIVTRLMSARCRTSSHSAHLCSCSFLCLCNVLLAQLPVQREREKWGGGGVKGGKRRGRERDIERDIERDTHAHTHPAPTQFAKKDQLACTRRRKHAVCDCTDIQDTDQNTIDTNPLQPRPPSSTTLSYS